MILDVGCGSNPSGDVNVDQVRKGGYNPQEGDQLKGEFFDPKKIPNYVIAEASHLPFKKGAFNVAYSSHTIEHLRNPEAFLKEMTRVSDRKVIIRYPHKRGSGAKRPYHVSFIDEDRIGRAALSLGYSSEQFTRSQSFIFTDPLSRYFKPKFPPYRILRGAERRLVRWGFLKTRPFEVEAWIRNPEPANDLSTLIFVVPVNDQEIYDKAFRSSVIKGGIVKFNNKNGVGLPLIYNAIGDLLSRSRLSFWIVFCHQDFILREDLSLRLRGKDKNSVYGPIGVYAGTTKLIGQITQTDDTLAGHKLPDVYPVQTLDEMCLIVHSSAFAKGLRFDERFPFHFYGADLCMSAFKLGLDVHALQVDCQHKSRSVSGDNGREFAKTKKVFADKWRAFFPIKTTCATFDRGV